MFVCFLWTWERKEKKINHHFHENLISAEYRDIDKIQFCPFSWWSKKISTINHSNNSIWDGCIITISQAYMTANQILLSLWRNNAIFWDNYHWSDLWMVFICALKCHLIDKVNLTGILYFIDQLHNTVMKEHQPQIHVHSDHDIIANKRLHF